MSAKVARYKFPPVAFNDILRCFSNDREDKYQYLGISWNIFKEGTDLHEYLEDFIMFVAKRAKQNKKQKHWSQLLHMVLG